jgi:MSHA biogenesis protein MshQ
VILGGVAALEEEESSLLSVRTVKRVAQPGGGYPVYGGYAPPPAYGPPAEAVEEAAAASVIVDSFETENSLDGIGSWVNTVTFREPMAATPVVVGFMSGNGGHPAQVRIFDVTSEGFKAAVIEPPSCATCFGGDGPHMAETVNYIAAVPGETTIGDMTILAGLEEGVSTTVGSPLFGKDVTNSWTDVDFGESFEGKPALLAALQSTNSFNLAGSPTAVAPFLTAGVTSVSAAGAKVSLERSEVMRGSVAAENLGWIAISTGTGSFDGGDGNEVSYKVENAMRGEKRLGWGDAEKGGMETVNLEYGTAGEGDDVITVAATSSRRGNNGGWLRSPGHDDKGITIVVDEDTFHDEDRVHIPEEVSSAIFSSAFSYP